jgi:hypothetical protein
MLTEGAETLKGNFTDNVTYLYCCHIPDLEFIHAATCKGRKLALSRKRRRLIIYFENGWN